MRMLTTVVVIALMTSQFPLYGQLSGTEKKIINAVDRHNGEAIELLKKTVNINSGSMNLEGVKKVGEVFRKKFDELGLETRWVGGDKWQRAGHLIAVHKGSGNGPRLLLIGHLDTVFEPDSPFQTYTMLNDSLMQGPGVADMKGGNVIIVQAIQALKAANVLDKMSIEVVLTGDEERSGDPLELARADLIEAAKNADIALGFENGDGNPKTIVVARRGSQGWELRVKGVQAHSSLVFTEEVGAGAIYEASRILMEFYKRLSSEKDLTFNPGLLLAGTSVNYSEKEAGGQAYGKSNVVAGEAIVKGDLRAVSPEQLERVKNMMQEIVKDHLPQTSAELVFREGAYPPLPPSEGNYRLLEMYSLVSQELGYGPVDPVNPRDAGAADISFTSGLVDMAVDGIGLSGSAGHNTDETGNLNMLPVQAKRAAVLMYRLAYEKFK